MADDYAASTATTGSVSVNGSKTGAVEAAGDADWFKVTLTAGVSYVFNMEGNATGQGSLSDPFMRVRNSSGSIIVSDDDSGTGLNARVSYTATSSGTYYVSAGSATSSGTGTYRVSVAANAPADDYAAGTSTTGLVSIGGSKSGSIETAGDADWFKVTLSAGRTYTFDLKGGATGDGTLSDPFMRLRDGGGNILQSDDDTGSGLNARITYTAGSSGTFYLSVGSATTSGTGSYRVSAELQADRTAPTLSSSSPADGAPNVGVANNIILTFSEPVKAGSGAIEIYKANGTLYKSIAVSDTSQVGISGSTVTINPSSNLAPGAGYYVKLGAGVIQDLAGNGYAGLTTSTALNFTTQATATNIANAFRHPLGSGYLTEQQTTTYAGHDEGYYTAKNGTTHHGFYVASNFNVRFEVKPGVFGNHLGEDWNGSGGGNTDAGVPVYAIANGKVIYSTSNLGLGNYVVIEHTLPAPEMINGQLRTHVYSLYAHLEASSVAVGGTVGIGQQIGTLGASGHANKVAHLHFEIRLVDPRSGANYQDFDGYHPSSAPSAWVDPTNFINSHRQIGAASAATMATMEAWPLDDRHTPPDGFEYGAAPDFEPVDVTHSSHEWLIFS